MHVMADLRPHLTPFEILIGALLLTTVAAVLLPAVRQAGEAADIARCRSNLYEIGKAVYLYAADHDGKTPPNSDPSTGNPSENWGTYVADRSLGLLLAERDGGSGPAGYIGRPHDLFCPSYHPDLHNLSGFKSPAEISQENPLIRIGYIWIYYPPANARSNAHTAEDRHRPLAFDQGPVWMPYYFALPAHESVMNVLHLGGHVTTVSREEADTKQTKHALYDWMTEQSRIGHRSSFVGGEGN